MCGDIANVSLCRDNTYTLGSAMSEVMSYDSYSNRIQLKYNYSNGNWYSSYSYVYLACGYSDVPYVNITNGDFVLTSKYACITPGFNGGYMILIIFASLILILVAFGIIFHVCTKMRR